MTATTSGCRHEDETALPLPALSADLQRAKAERDGPEMSRVRSGTETQNDGGPMTISDELLEAYGEKKLNEPSHWVYVLQCRQPYYEYDECRRKAETRIGREPDWLRAAFEADRIYYIGQTENLEKRLGEHWKREKAAELTKVFEPASIVELVPEFSRNQAEYEEQRRQKMWDATDGIFAYAR